MNKTQARRILVETQPSPAATEPDLPATRDVAVARAMFIYLNDMRDTVQRAYERAWQPENRQNGEALDAAITIMQAHILQAEKTLRDNLIAAALQQ